MNKGDLSSRLKQYAINNGIDLIGITSANPFIVQRKREAFVNPKDILKDAKAVIVTGFYINEKDKTTLTESNSLKGRYNAYDVKAFTPMEKHHTKTISSFLENEGYSVTTNNIHKKNHKNHKIPDKMAAIRAGLGKYGKNSLVITQKFGSFIMFVTMVTNAPLEYEEFSINETDCGKCDICIKSCPTGAIYAPFKVNRDLCITAWLWGDFVPIHLREKQENRLFGCGECVKACPKNKKLKSRAEYPTKIESLSDNPDLIPLLTADKKYFKKTIASFPLCAGEEAILGNAIIALGNIGDSSSAPALKQTVANKNPQIRAYSIWALGRIGGKDSINILQNALLNEKDSNVVSEIHYALDTIKN
ncbi:MAG: hypothetical protein EHM93_18980 [Bacteroidales bacterium]|nr:MAG: hypothetical protein EHM93_18980 [Bacteroidales bacterium]